MGGWPVPFYSLGQEPRPVPAQQVLTRVHHPPPAAYGTSYEDRGRGWGAPARQKPLGLLGPSQDQLQKDGLPAHAEGSLGRAAAESRFTVKVQSLDRTDPDDVEKEVATV